MIDLFVSHWLPNKGCWLAPPSRLPLPLNLKPSGQPQSLRPSLPLFPSPSKTKTAGCSLITPLDLLRCVGVAPPFGSAAHPAHYALLLELFRDVLPSVGLIKTASRGGIQPPTTSETSTAVASAMLSGAAALVEGACESHRLAVAAAGGGGGAAAAGAEGTGSGSSAAVHVANLAAALSICKQLFSTPRFCMLLKIGARHTPSTLAKLRAAWAAFGQQEGQSQQLSATLATQLDLSQAVAALAGNSDTAAAYVGGENGSTAADAAAAASTAAAGGSSGATNDGDGAGPAAIDGAADGTSSATALNVLAMIEATRCHTPTQIRAKQWCYCADWDRVPLSEMLSTLWLLGLNELAQCATTQPSSSSTPASGPSAASLPSSPSTLRWLNFLCIRVPALARAVCDLKPSAYGHVDHRKQQVTEALAQVGEHTV